LANRQNQTISIRKGLYQVLDRWPTENCNLDSRTGQGNGKDKENKPITAKKWLSRIALNLDTFRAFSALRRYTPLTYLEAKRQFGEEKLCFEYLVNCM
jgi:hypothetical protein